MMEMTFPMKGPSFAKVSNIKHYPPRCGNNQLRWGKDLSDSICERKLADADLKKSEVRQHPDIDAKDKAVLWGV